MLAQTCMRMGMRDGIEQSINQCLSKAMLGENKLICRENYVRQGSSPSLYIFAARADHLGSCKKVLLRKSIYVFVIKQKTGCDPHLLILEQFLHDSHIFICLLHTQIKTFSNILTMAIMYIGPNERYETP